MSERSTWEEFFIYQLKYSPVEEMNLKLPSPLLQVNNLSVCDVLYHVLFC